MIHEITALPVHIAALAEAKSVFQVPMSKQAVNCRFAEGKNCIPKALGYLLLAPFALTPWSDKRLDRAHRA